MLRLTDPESSSAISVKRTDGTKCFDFHACGHYSRKKGVSNLSAPDLCVPGRKTNLSVQFIHLLETQALGLIDAEIHERDADAAEAAPDEEDFAAEVRVAGAWVHHLQIHPVSLRYSKIVTGSRGQLDPKGKPAQSIKGRSLT